MNMWEWDVIELIDGVINRCVTYKMFQFRERRLNSKKTFIYVIQRRRSFELYHKICRVMILDDFAGCVEYNEYDVPIIVNKRSSCFC